jgi:hypothetical protein
MLLLQQLYHQEATTHFQALLICVLTIMGPIMLLPERQLVPNWMRITAANLGTHGYIVEDMFRLPLQSILLLAPLLLPLTFRTSERDKVNCVEGLCLVLRRLSFPSRWKDLVMVFGRSKASLSRIFIHVMELLMTRHEHLLEFNPFRFQHRLAQWAAAIAAKGVDPALGIAIFIDGTLRGVARPNIPAHNQVPPWVTQWQLQASLFSGHKWKHGLKFQGLNAPNGLILSCFGPRGGFESDCKLLADSLVSAMFHLMDYGGQRYRIFGDSIYPLMHHLLRPFLAAAAGSAEAFFNAVMSQVFYPRGSPHMCLILIVPDR